MANCYLCQYVTFAGPGGEPARVPAGVREQLAPGVGWGSIDISADGKGGGKDWAFVATDGTLAEQANPRIIDCGTETTPVTQAQRNRLSAALGIPITGTTLGAVVEEVLVSQGLVVQPESDGMVRIWLGSVLLVERPA